MPIILLSVEFVAMVTAKPRDDKYKVTACGVRLVATVPQHVLILLVVRDRSSTLTEVPSPVPVKHQ